MNAVKVSPWKLFIVRARECGRLLVVLMGGSAFALVAAGTGTVRGAIVATVFGLLTTAGIYSGQRLAAWRIQQEIARPRSKAVTGCDCHR